MNDGSQKLKIVVCDDRRKECERCADNVDRISGVKSNRLHGESLTNAFSSLSDSENAFYEADLVFIDYRLEQLRGPFSPTSENVIGRIRAEAGAKYIVSINVFPDVDFDLKDLFGARESAADLSIAVKNVDAPALWGTGTGGDGFHPSYWPNLFEAPNRRKRQVDAIRSNLDRKVFEFLDINDSRQDRLPTDALSSLFPRGGESTEAKNAKFVDIFKAAARDLSRELTDEVLENWKENSDDRLADVAARVCAFKVERWLRLHVLGPQDILVDLPHLIDRAPQILGADRIANIEVWNMAAGAQNTKRLDKNFADVVNEFEFKNWNLWFDRPVYWWTDLSEVDEIVWPELDEGVELPDFVFCEDTSQFVKGNGQTPFQIHQVSANRRRFIQRIEGRTYAPLSQLVPEVE